MSTNTETVVIGGGQAGLAMSHCLTRLQIPHVVVERRRIGERWWSERWPSLRLLTPNWMTRLPGFRYDGPDPNGFMLGTEFAGLLKNYAASFNCPVREQTEVLAVTSAGEGYEIATSRGRWRTRSVVVASGACDVPSVPRWGRRVPADVLQLTPDRYKGPEKLPAGGVLVVGASATGLQLASEIQRSGRQVTLAVGRHVRVPRRYRDRDLMEWLDGTGFLADPRPAGADPAHLLAQPSLQLVGGSEGADLDLYRLRKEGVRITGRAVDVAGHKIYLASDLEAERQAAERRRAKILSRIDDYAASRDLSCANVRSATTTAPLPAAPLSLDLVAEGIETIVWATGYRRSYPWLKLPILDANGEIRNRGGVTPAPGVYTIGLPFMRHRASTFIDGVGRDAEALSLEIASYLRPSFAAAA